MGWGIAISAAISLGSMLYQHHQQKKARKKAKKERDKNSGIDVVVDAKVTALHLVYGRMKVGGNRVFHNVKSDVFIGDSNADITFETAKKLETLKKKRNGFLFFQQALCKRGFSTVYDTTLDDRLITDPFLSIANNASRIDVHYGNDEHSCELMSDNFMERNNAKFPGAAFLSAIIRRDKSEPQFSAVPDVKIFGEGCKIHGIENGVLTTPTYSNNNALILLDYLHVERGIDLEFIDLDSFERGKEICDRIVLYNTPVGGLIWKPASGSRYITERDLSLYECNIAIDTTKPFRENIDKILSTMGDARLVWSQGIYKLSIQYAQNEAEANALVVDNITEDKLILGGEIKINWPDANTRLNHCTVQFKNEAENFNEDTASWPMKLNSSYYKGIGAVRYTPINGWDKSTAGRFLNSYAVQEISCEHTRYFEWKIKLPHEGDEVFTLDFVGDREGSISISTLTLEDPLGNPAQTPYEQWTNRRTHLISSSVTLTGGVEYTISGSLAPHGDFEDGDRCGFAAALTNADNVQVWNTRDPSYSGFIDVENSNEVYLQMLAEDNGIELETSVDVDGLVTFQHALAKAEEMVRTSRTAFSVEFSYLFGDKFPEPGDIVTLKVADIDIDTPIQIKLEKVELRMDGGVNVKGSYFHYTQLAWNVDDNYYEQPPIIFDTKVPVPMNLQYIGIEGQTRNSAGKLVWPLVDDDRVVNYELFMTTEVTELDPEWNSLGSSVTSPFTLPDLIEENQVIFGVKSKTRTGKLSGMRVSDTVSLSKAIPPVPTSVSLDFLDGSNNSIIEILWTIPQLRPDGSLYSNHNFTRIFCSTTDDFNDATKIGEQKDFDFLYSPVFYGELHYWIQIVSQGRTSANWIASVPFYCGSITANFINEDPSYDLTPPEAPINLTLTSSALNVIALSWGIPPTENWSKIAVTEIYRNTVDDRSTSELIASVVGAVFSDTVEFNSTYYYWVRFVSKGAKFSEYNSVSGLECSTSEDVAQLLLTLSEEISESELTQSLNDRLDSFEDEAWIPRVEAVESIQVDAIGPEWVSGLITPENFVVTHNGEIFKRLSGKPPADSIWYPSNWLQVTASVYAEYTIKIDANGKVIGIGLSSDGPGNASDDFIVIADKFAVMRPNTPWVPSTSFSLNDTVLPTTFNNYMYIVTQAGTTSGTEPTWPTTPDQTVLDGTVEFTCKVYESIAPFIVDSETGIVHMSNAFITELEATNFVGGKIIANEVVVNIELNSPIYTSGTKTMYGVGSGAFISSDGSFDFGDSTSYIRKQIGGILETTCSIKVLNPSDVRDDLNVSAGADNTSSALGYNASNIGDWAHDPIARVNSQTTFISGGRIEVGTIVAGHISVNGLSDIKKDIGTITAGVMRLGTSASNYTYLGEYLSYNGLFINGTGSGHFRAGTDEWFRVNCTQTGGQIGSQHGISFKVGGPLNLYGDVVATGNIQANNVTEIVFAQATDTLNVGSIEKELLMLPYIGAGAYDVAISFSVRVTGDNAIVRSLRLYRGTSLLMSFTASVGMNTFVWIDSPGGNVHYYLKALADDYEIQITNRSIYAIGCKR